MTTQAQEEKAKNPPEKFDPFEVAFGERKSTTSLDWAVLGCLVAGAVGIYKACNMETRPEFWCACSVRSPRLAWSFTLTSARIEIGNADAVRRFR
jgi:hypothetical protein